MRKMQIKTTDTTALKPGSEMLSSSGEGGGIKAPPNLADKILKQGSSLGSHTVALSEIKNTHSLQHSNTSPPYFSGNTILQKFVTFTTTQLCVITNHSFPYQQDAWGEDGVCFRWKVMQHSGKATWIPRHDIVRSQKFIYWMQKKKKVKNRTSLIAQFCNFKGICKKWDLLYFLRRDIYQNKQRW